MKTLALAVAAVAISAAPAAAGCERIGIAALDCPVRHPSTATVNANDRIKGAVDPDQWARHNANTDAIEASAAQRAAAEAADRTSRAYEKEASAGAKAENARGNLINAISGNVNSKR